jgi:hypothetical protein
MIYAISAQGMGLGLLKDIAEDTGGGYLEVRADADLKETMTRVAEELRHQYMLGFTPPVIDGKPHRLTVRLKTSGLRVSAPREYVAQPKRP